MVIAVNVITKDGNKLLGKNNTFVASIEEAQRFNSLQDYELYVSKNKCLKTIVLPLNLNYYLSQTKEYYGK